MAEYIEKARVERFCNDTRIEMTICDAEMRKAHEEMIRLQERLNLFSDRKTMLQGLLQTVGEIPAADVAPVVHGYWTQVDDTKCRCSNCDIIALVGLYPHGDKNYCPNCGAKMDEGKGDFIE